MKKFNIFLKQTLADFVGAFLFSVAISTFISPNKITSGGLAGIAIILNNITNIKIGTLTMIMNIPIFICAFIYLNKNIMIRTFKSVLIFTFISNYMSSNFPIFTEDLLLSSVFGGILMGCGIGIVFRSGSTLGGSDIVVKTINKYFPKFELSQIIFTIDFIVVSSSFFVFKDTKLVLYGLIVVMMTSITIQKVLYLGGDAKIIYIISNKKDEITSYIINLGLSVTSIKAVGCYENKNQDILMCAVNKSNYFRIKNKTLEIDQNAFIAVLNSNQIISTRFNLIK